MTADTNYDIELSRVFDAPLNRLYSAFVDVEHFVQWYGPDGFPVDPETAEIDPRVGGTHRFVMVFEADPAMRTSFDGQFTDVIEGQLLTSSGEWTGIPGVEGGWPSNLKVEFTDEEGKTRVVVREGPHPDGSVDMGRQSWEMMFTKLEKLVSD